MSSRTSLSLYPYNLYLYNMEKEIIQSIEKLICTKLSKDSSGHDWWHILRVRNLALHIAEKEDADIHYCEMLALLHETADHKLVKDENASLSELSDFLKKQHIKDKLTQQLIHEIPLVSYRGAGVPDKEASLECNIVRDADRLDAIGAIGIARTFAYGGKHDRLLYHPNIKPENHTSFESYKNSNNATINHFYEKLLLLKERMHTKTAKNIALKRHKRMEDFLVNFLNEWDLKDLT